MRREGGLERSQVAESNTKGLGGDSAHCAHLFIVNLLVVGIIQGDCNLGTPRRRGPAIGAFSAATKVAAEAVAAAELAAARRRGSCIS